MLFKTSLLLMAVSLLATGCSTLSPQASAPDQLTPEAGAPGYVLRMERGAGQPKIYRGVIADQMTIQDALVESNAVRKYRDMNIEIIRRVRETGQPMKLVVDYEPGKKRVKPEQNYALHPGDRIRVTPNSNGALDQLVSMALLQGPSGQETQYVVRH